MTEYAHPEVLVSTQWVADRLNDPSLRIVESNEDILLYDLGHIPGAVQIDWQKDLNDAVRRDYLTRPDFEALMAANGIANDTTVVFYGDKNNWWATYAFWVFQLFGHARTRDVMDGGRAKWEKEGAAHGPRSSLPTRPPPTLAHPRRGLQDPRAARSVLAHDAGRPVRWSMCAAPSRVQRRRAAHGQLSAGRARSAAATSLAPRTCPGRARSIPTAPSRARPNSRRSTWNRTASRAPTTSWWLLPHRRAQQPHVVRAHLPARLREGPQLRRQLDGVGQPRRRADREVTPFARCRDKRDNWPAFRNA
jgi:hypothetical protein